MEQNNMTDAQVFGARMAASRCAIRPKVSQRDAGRIVGKTEDAITKYETGKTVPKMDVAAALAYAYGADLNEWARGLFRH